jgi:ferric-dicitrate binding protein FerR (iron transport regulator)
MKRKFQIINKKLNCEKDNQLYNDIVDLAQDNPASARKFVNSLKFVDSKQTENFLISEEQSFDDLFTKINRKNKKNLWLRISVASVILLIIATSLIFIQPKEIEYDLYSTLENQKSEITLNDGTVIYLKSNTEIKVPKNFNSNNRSLEMDGEAYFEVTHNPESKFEVKSHKFKLTVLGTKFNLKSSKDNNLLKVSLTEGKIEADITEFTNDKADKFILTKGENLLYDKMANNNLLVTFNRRSTISWKNNFLLFDNVKLKDIAKDMSIFYEKYIRIDDKDLAEVEFYGEFENKSIDHILRSFQKIYPFNITKNKGKYLLTKLTK